MLTVNPSLWIFIVIMIRCTKLSKDANEAHSYFRLDNQCTTEWKVMAMSSVVYCCITSALHLLVYFGSTEDRIVKKHILEVV